MKIGVGKKDRIVKGFTIVFIIIFLFSSVDLFSMMVNNGYEGNSLDLPDVTNNDLGPQYHGRRSEEPYWSSFSGSLPTINDYYGIDFGDVNNDGKLDIVAASGQMTTDGIHCWISDGEGNWIEQSNGLPSSGWFTDVELGDLNNDGKLDIACGGGIWTGDGGEDGQMDWAPQNNPPYSWFGVALGDVNCDGITDIAAGTSNWGIRVWTSNGGEGGSFLWNASNGSLPSAGQYYGVYLGDVNNDGKLDLAAVSNEYEGIKVWTGNGQTEESAVWTDAFSGTGLPTTGDYSQVCFGDANNDGKLDIAAGKRPGGVKFWKGNGGEGGFTWIEESNGLATTGRYYGLAFDDVNNDGKLDLVGGDWAVGGIGVWLGDGGEGGELNWTSASEGLPDSSDTLDICLGDLNNDGRIDIGATTETQGIQVWIGNLPDLEITGWISASTNLPTSAGWHDVFFGDVNHDGKLDLAATSNSNQGVKVWLGDGNGVWSEISDPDLPSLGNYNGVRLIDVNHDGDLDLIAGNDSNYGGKVWLGDGSGGFGPDIGPESITYMGGVEVADINCDGNMDISSSRYQPISGSTIDKVYIWLGDGNGGWGSDTGPSQDLGYDDTAFGDVDHDGDLDLFATGHMQGYRFWLGDGTGNWNLQPQNGLPTDTSGLGACFGDVDHDGNLDIAIASWAVGPSGVRVFTSNGGASGTVLWTEESNGLPISGEYAGMELGDINNDGNLDILTATCWGSVSGIALYLGNGGQDGSMVWTDGLLPNLPTSGEYWGVAYGDVNNDGVLDIALGSESNGVEVYITQTRPSFRIDLEEGWNLISLPLIQSDTNIKAVFQSIDGEYNAVQCYDTQDKNDPWKHYQLEKPPEWSDLSYVDHTMGIWIYITQPGGTALNVYGDEIDIGQSIIIRPGWNLVGFPSKSDKQIDAALNNIDFGTDVDWVGYFDATEDNFVPLSDSDNMELGRGYWVHSVREYDIVWDVPL